MRAQLIREWLRRVVGVIERLERAEGKTDDAG